MKLSEITEGQTVTCTEVPGSVLTVQRIATYAKGVQRMVVVADADGETYKLFARNLRVA